MTGNHRRRVDPSHSAAELSSLLESFGLYIGVEVDGDVISLVGQIDSDENRDAALDLARSVASRDGLLVQDSMEVVKTSPSSAFNVGGGGSLSDSRPSRDAAEEGEAVATSLEVDINDPIGTTDSEEAAAEAIPYFPPTDPVVRSSDDAEELEVVGGFSATSMDEGQEGEPLVESHDDEEIVENVLRELREDASTTDLDVNVTVDRGVVTLRGAVPSLEDADNVEAVAARTAGVVETEEQLHIVAFDDQLRPT